MSRPLILLDVDGPLNPWAAKPTRRPAGYETHRMRPLGYDLGISGKKPLRVWLNPEHGPLLRKLAEDTDAELTWCTTWLEQANALIAPLIGLPRLPVVEWLIHETDWKFLSVLRYAEDRPVLWFDDDFDQHPMSRQSFLESREARGARTMLHHVDPKFGLRPNDFALAREWLLLERGI
jgi:hypothetical protein